MQPTSLKYFYEVARLRSIRKASDKLFVAASAVSRQIALLEHQLGVKLVERLARGVELTHAGEIVFRHLQESFAEQQRALSWIEEIKGGRRGHVRVASIEGFVTAFLPRVLRAFREQQPQVRVELMMVGTDRVTDMLREFECEIGLVFQPKDLSKLSSSAELGSAFSACMAPDHALARRPSLSMADLAGHPVVLTEASFSSRNLVDVALREAEVSLDVAVETNSIEGAKALARTGVGIIFLPAFAIERERRQGELVAVPLTDPAFAGAKVMVLTKKGRRLSPAADRLLAQLVAEFETALV